MTIIPILDELHARQQAFREWWRALAQRPNGLPEEAAMTAYYAGWKARAEWKTNEGERE